MSNVNKERSLKLPRVLESQISARSFLIDRLKGDIGDSELNVFVAIPGDIQALTGVCAGVSSIIRHANQAYPVTTRLLNDVGETFVMWRG